MSYIIIVKEDCQRCLDTVNLMDHFRVPYEIYNHSEYSDQDYQYMQTRYTLKGFPLIFQKNDQNSIRYIGDSYDMNDILYAMI